MSTPIDLAVSKIRIDGETQQRPLDDDAVTEYAAWLAEGRVPPPVQVVYDGKDAWLWDGFHRYHAADRAGKASIPALVIKGDKRKAQWLSFSANKDHGVRRQKGVVKEILEKIFADPQWKDTPQNKIAEHVGVTQGYISRMRAHLITSNKMRQNVDHEDLLKRGIPDAITTQGSIVTVTRNGTTYSMNTANIGHGDSLETSQSQAAEMAETIMNQSPVGESSPAPQPPPVPRDLDDNPIQQDNIRDIFARRNELQEFTTALTKVKTAVLKGIQNHDPLFRQINEAGFKAAMEAARFEITSGMPHGICPVCGGESIGGRCRTCAGSGWLGKVRYENAKKQMEAA